MTHREDEIIEIHVQLTRAQAWAAAQFLKRMGYSDYLLLGVDRAEAEQMLDAGEAIRDALNQGGFNPR